MKTFQDFKDEVAKRKGKKFKFLPSSVYNEAVELYAAQFKIYLSPDRILTQEEFNKQYEHYQEILQLEDVVRFHAESVIAEPTEEEVDKAWDDWYRDNGGSNTGSAWDSAIEWYKTKIGMS